MIPVVRIGDAVHRATGPWTPVVHRLLRHLDAVGFDGTPRVLGIDPDGREILTYVDGEAGYFDADRTVPPDLWSDRVLTDAATFLRRFHDATATFVPAAGTGWATCHPDPTRHEVICHNDFAPYNCIFRDGYLRAAIDLDGAGPGPRTRDLAYAAYTFVPLFRDEGCRAVGLAQPPDRGQRLRLFCDAYGLDQRTGLVELIEERVRAVATLIRDAAAAGDGRFRRKIDEGHLAGYEADAAFLRRRREAIQCGL